jgi:hypothetical protein
MKRRRNPYNNTTQISTCEIIIPFDSSASNCKTRHNLLNQVCNISADDMGKWLQYKNLRQAQPTMWGKNTHVQSAWTK